MDKAIGKRLEGLDSLRGIAATMVIFFHVLYLGGYADKSVFTPIVSKLDIGVRLFYALSAFSLFYGYETKIDKNNGVKNFYINRFFRIAPLFYLCIIYYIVALPLLFNAKLEITDILANAAFVFALLPGKQESIVWAGWSIGVEWIFYFVFPLFVVLNKKLKYTMILFLFSTFVFLRFDVLGSEIKKISNSSFELNFFNQLIFFVAGILSYKIYELGSFKTKKFKMVFPMVCIPFLCLYFGTEIINNKIGDILIAVCFSFIILYFSYFPPRVLTNRFFISLGLSSFGLYLIHPIVLIIYMKTGFLQRIHFPNHESISYILLFICTFLLTFLLSFTSYKYYEKPLMRIGKKYIS